MATPGGDVCVTRGFTNGLKAEHTLWTAPQLLSAECHLRHTQNSNFKDHKFI